MASTVLQQQVSSMQHEANLLHDHARVLSNFANGLSSYASTLSYQSQTYYAKSDELNKLAGYIMAGAPILDPDSAEEDDIPVVRVTAEVARAAETMDVRTGVQNMVQGLIRMLSGQDLASSPLSQAAMKKCQGAFENAISQEQSFAAICGMAFVGLQETKQQRGADLGSEDVEAADAVVEEYSESLEAPDDVLVDFSDVKKHFKALVKNPTATTKGKEQVCSATCQDLVEVQLRQEGDQGLDWFGP
jgi:hypothetical protein